MSELNSIPAPTIPSSSVAPGEGVQQAAGGGVVPVRRPVCARVTWILSTAFGAGGWLLIFAAIAGMSSGHFCSRPCHSLLLASSS